MSGSAAFLEAVKARRSIYTIGSESTISDEKIEEIIATAVKHAPSSFNVQSSRVRPRAPPRVLCLAHFHIYMLTLTPDTQAVLLLGDEHKKLWEITLNVLKGIVPADQLPATEGKINGCFAAGHGTVLFFEDQEGVKALQAQYPTYQDRFPAWSEHASVRPSPLPLLPFSPLPHHITIPIASVGGSKADARAYRASCSTSCGRRSRRRASARRCSTTTRSSARRCSRRGTCPRRGSSSRSCRLASRPRPRARRRSSPSRASGS